MKKLTIIFVAYFIFTSQIIIAGSNTNYGDNAGSSGSYNSCYGYYAGNVTSGVYNTFIGSEACRNETGIYNTAVGSNAGVYNTTGSSNCFFGKSSALSSKNTDLDKECIFGQKAGYNLSGDGNCIFGYYSGLAMTGIYNSTYGYYSGVSSTGSYNSFLGFYAGTASSGSYNVFLGRYAGYGKSVSNTLVIENSTSTPLIYGSFSANQVSINTTTLGYTLNVNGTVAASSYYTSSDSSLKENIESIDGAMDLLNNIAGYTYNFKQTIQLPANTASTKSLASVKALADENSLEIDEEVALEATAIQNENEGLRIFPKGKQYGIIAQEVQEVFPALVAEDSTGSLSVNYDGFIPILIQAVKELSAENDSLKTELVTKNENLEVQLEQLTEQYNSLVSTISSMQSSMGLETSVTSLNNYPNPFNESTTIEYSIPNGTTAQMIIYNINGEIVKTINSLSSEGSINFNANSLSSGTYICTLYDNGKQLANNTMIIK